MLIFSRNKDDRFFQVDTMNGDIISDSSKKVSNKIKLIREIPIEEIHKYIEDNLDILIKDEYWEVRKTVAEQGYGLDVLIKDKDGLVRRAAGGF